MDFSSQVRADHTLLIFADVDGTLLDSSGTLPASPQVMRAALSALARDTGMRVVLALASSRTLPELLVLQRAIGLAGPCIAEDGAVIAVDESMGGTTWSASPLRAGRRTLRTATLGTPATVLREELASHVSVSQHDLVRLDARHLAGLGFRTSASVRRALMAREASVLLDLRGLDDRSKELVTQSIERRGGVLHCGGRWHTITHNAGKGRAVDRVRHVLSMHDGTRMITASIGNEENDATLLAATDLAYAVNNPGRGPHHALLAVPGAVALENVGTRGFEEMLDRIRVTVQTGQTRALSALIEVGTS